MRNNQYLIGPVGVRLVMVGGGDQPEFTVPEQEFVVDQTRMTLNHLAELEPRARLNFDFDSRYVEISVTSRVHDNVTDAMETAWRDDAFAELGFKSYQAFLEHEFVAQPFTQRFLVLVSSLPMPHFAYSTEDKITLARHCGGYVRTMMHALLLHEICHLFGAADETDACHCHAKHGYLKGGPDNCYLCKADPEPCIMAANSLRICASTRKQIGWHPSLFHASAEPRHLQP